ncbi:hypothetical protein PROFUN_04700 [Planoprotostelium fungivorum]|uniref:Uncharacterized protein n=1 Tax=Planoprotostelium fungivorum TaxID=1890364 RepID=A0A2P6NFU7_9EUKA|nr:hypothetical protein PROFUN_04700 [Planoprotostelium fungivorum]
MENMSPCRDYTIDIGRKDCFNIIYYYCSHGEKTGSSSYTYPNEEKTEGLDFFWLYPEEDREGSATVRDKENLL